MQSQPREARTASYVAIRKLLVSYFRPDHCNVDHEEFVETGIENRHSLRLVSPMKLGQRTVLQSPRLSENRVLSLNEFRNFGLAIPNLMRGTDFLEPLNLVYRFIFIA
jgi:hypothetical protein